MRSDRVVVDAPRVDEPSGFFEADEPFLIQTFFPEASVPEASVERLDVSILGGFAGIEVQLHLVLLGPNIQRFASKLRPVIDLKQLRLAKLLGDSLQGTPLDGSDWCRSRCPGSAG